MIIEINNSKTVGEIQQEFTKRFPLLKLEFFSKSHKRENRTGGSPCQPESTLGSIRHTHKNGMIMINPKDETGSVEMEFKHRFDLNVQIYRKQADRWIQTAGSDILTIDEQCEIAKKSASASKFTQ